MEHYKSWSALKKQLDGYLCEELKGRISYFLTRYHDVHNSYGRASIRLDGRELVCFSWIEMYHQENDAAIYMKTMDMEYEDAVNNLRPQWDENCTYNEMDFLDAV